MTNPQPPTTPKRTPAPALWPTAHQAILAGQSPAIPGPTAPPQAETDEFEAERDALMDEVRGATEVHYCLDCGSLQCEHAHATYPPERWQVRHIESGVILPCQDRAEAEAHVRESVSGPWVAEIASPPTKTDGGAL